MNRGTALKWIEKLKSGFYLKGSFQLRYDDDEGLYPCGYKYFCVLGVLADFLDPNGWEKDYIGYSWHGSKFYLDSDSMKKCKFKNGEEFQRLIELNDQYNHFGFCIQYIEDNYEKL